MAITQADFSALTDDLQEIWNETAKTKIDEVVGNKLFQVRDTSRRTHDELILHGVSGISEVTPGQDLPTVTSEQGDQITYTQRYFGGTFAVTKEMRKFDLYDQIEGLARSLTEDAFDGIDQSYADVLGFGWSTTYTDVWGGTVTSTGPDGVALISASHSNDTTSRTYDNRILNSAGTPDPVVSRDAIVYTRSLAMRYKDPNALVRPIMLDTIVVTPVNEDVVERILYSTQLSGSANNDINPLKGKLTNLIVWPRLTTLTGGTDAAQYWFLCQKSKVGETLKAKFAERPSLDAPEQIYANKNWTYSCDFFYTVGIGFEAFLYGSRGTAV